MKMLTWTLFLIIFTISCKRNQGLSIRGDLSIKRNTISIVSDETVIEGDTLPIQLTLNKALAYDVSFDLKTLPVSASENVDYFPIDKRVTIPAGSLSETVYLETVGDLVVETNTKSLNVLISNIEGVEPAQDNFSISILDYRPARSLNNIVKAYSGLFINCFVDANGRVACVGGVENDHVLAIPLGDRYKRTRYILGIDNPIDLSFSGNHMCGLFAGDQVLCWGNNGSNKLGLSPYAMGSSPTQTLSSGSDLKPGATVSRVFAGYSTTCILLDDGDLYCWGRNTRGQVGGNIVMTTADDYYQVQGLLGDVKEVELGESHSCALLTDGQVQCWGYNNKGQIGVDPIISTQENLATTAVPLPNQASAISIGWRFSCALLINNEVYCWGNNGSGILGLEPTSLTDSHIPQKVGGFSDTPVQISAAKGPSQYICARLNSGDIQCWGTNSVSTLGSDDTNLISHQPLKINSFPGKAIDVSSGQESACAVNDEGFALCWGRNSLYQNPLFLEDGFDRVWGPSLLSDKTIYYLDTYDESALSGDKLGCIVNQNRQIECTGNNRSKSLGRGEAFTGVIQPLGVVTGVSNADIVKVGDNFACALLTNGEMKCWGVNWGTGTSGGPAADVDPASSPIGLNSGVIDFDVWQQHVCALKEDGKVFCWGLSSNGKTGTCNNTQYAPNEITGLSNVVDVSLTKEQSCALTSAGEVYCWGSKDTSLCKTTPQKRDLPMPATKIAGECAILQDGSAYCENGKIENVPGKVVDLVKTYHTEGTIGSCLLLDTGTPLCWDESESESVDSLGKTPQPISGLPGGVKKLTPNKCFITMNDRVKCLGGRRGVMTPEFLQKPFPTYMFEF